ncbi:MAG: hypothetical protein Fur0012_05200 [Elusimicrobiota bacterium]
MDAELLTRVTEWAENTDLEEIVYSDGKDGFSVQNGFTNLCNYRLEPSIVNVNSPYVGLFRRSPLGRTLNLKEGDRVAKGDVLGYVEVLKEYKEIISPADGVIKTVCLNDGDCAQYNTALFFIEKN